jgi:putative transposase
LADDSLSRDRLPAEYKNLVLLDFFLAADCTTAMSLLLHPPFPLLACATEYGLARMVEYLKDENRVQRQELPKRITVTPTERHRLVRLGAKLGPAIKDPIGIVSLRLFARWVSGEKPATNKSTRKPGRPRTPEDIRALVLRIARETGWGYTLVLGELKQLGIMTVSRTTVINILREHGLDPGPQRGRGTWDEFIKLVDMFVLFFIHIGTRRVYVAGMTTRPDRAWVVQQARNAALYFAERGQKPAHILIDHDTRFVPEIDQVFEAEAAKVKRLGPCAPSLNAYAERWVQSVKQECLDHFVVFGVRHLRYLISEYTAHYYYGERPHQPLGNSPLTGPSADTHVGSGEVVCRERLGGLLRHYLRAA